MTLPRLSHQDLEGKLHVSKWLKHQLLLSLEEMDALLTLLDPQIFIGSEIVSEKNALVTKEKFLTIYQSYITALQTGNLPDITCARAAFSSILTKNADLLYAMQLGEERYFIRAIRPIIQLQIHQFFFSKIDATFHPMVLGKESVFWGLQISYPQIYQDPKTGAFCKVTATSEFPNTELFMKAAKWLRHATLPTPFLYEGKRINTPMRLGKDCFSWINKHPQLQRLGIGICALN